MLRVQDHQAGPAPRHDKILEVPDLLERISQGHFIALDLGHQGRARRAHLTSADGYLNGRVQAVAVLL